MNTTFYQSIEAELDELKAECRFRQLRNPASTADLINLSSNDYLGISLRKEWLREFIDSATVDDLAMSAVSSRLLTGNHQAYIELENDLSTFYNGRSALVFNSGYHANSGILPAIAGKGDLILSDKLNHASIIDGMKLSGAEFKRYRHLDYTQLEDFLCVADGKYRRIIVISESVFSMDGDVADLKVLNDLSKRYGAILCIDEAHSVGVNGKRGAGCCEEAGLIDDIDIIIGTLGKAFASSGAFAIIRPELKDYLINRVRPFIFTTGMPPINAAWSRFVLQKMPNLDVERQHLRELGEQLRNGLRSKKLNTLGNSQIVPLIVGENHVANELAEKISRNGFLALPVRPPTVPPDTARIRFSLHSGLKVTEVDNLLECL